ncbi:MAG TPA: hypothetical protein VIU11_12065 [Nakamurella sp.]
MSDPAWCEPELVGVDEHWQSPMTEILETVSADEFRRMLVDVDAPANLQDSVAEFGDDVGALADWLLGLADIVDTADEFDELMANWAQLSVRGTTAIEAEVFTGEFLWARQHTPGDPDPVDSLTFLLERAVENGSREALALCRCLARLGPAEIRQSASRCADRLATAGVQDMPWAKDLGRATFDHAFGYRDPFGMQETLVLVFRHGKKAHALAVLIDHQLGGGIKDLFTTAEPDRLRRHVRRQSIDRGFAIVQRPAQEVSAILQTALAAPVCAAAFDQVESVGVHMPVLRDRAALLMALAEPSAAPAADPKQPTQSGTGR